MKIALFDAYRVGVILGDAVVDVTEVVQGVPHTGPHNLMSGLIERFEALRGPMQAAADEGLALALNSVRLRAPLPKPGNIVCMAVNYMEDGTLAEKPLINGFHKAASSIIGPDEEMVLPDVSAKVFEGEAEIALVIGKRAQQVSAANAMEHVFGYINFIDGSARGLPPEGNTFFQSKSRDTFAAIGPYIVTADEVADPQNLRIRLAVNGVVKQDFNTNDMAHDIPRCIEWVSHLQTLEPGDILATGTNHRGLNAFQDGDIVELEAEGLGRLSIRVRDDLKRTWGRETRLEHKQKGLPGIVSPQLTGKYADGNH